VNPVGRGGLKLEAAIERFQLARAIAGARAVDIGASTGGFTEALLRHGATHVTAVDVGRGQLHPSLARDPRVTSLEGVDWKTLPLGEAAGPFDFFTVDVSFVAARSMLRGLAFRLRDGAEGVVLVKPQFELPDLRRADKIEALSTDENLRRRALDQVRTKAESLGFVLVAHADSPVAGGSGTVEILAHLRFVGRSARLPKPGERRRVERKVRQLVAPSEYHYFAVASPGIEPILVEEVRALPGARAVSAVAGGVEFAGPLEVCLRANLWLRTATRVLVRLGEIEAREFSKLRHRAAGLPWDRFVAGPVEVSASQTRSRLYHTGAIAENLQAAIDDAVKTRGEGEPLKVLARGVADRFTLSIDSSGELLHRRGWRTETAHAPLRETLAAALLFACGWDPSMPFVDPMCGAGTLPIEAAALAMRRAPGLDRAFAFERWPAFDAALWSRLRDEARAQALPSPPATILGSDHAPAVVAVAQRNLERAGLAAHVQLAARELDEVRAPSGTGLVLTNAPYGKRVGDPRALRPLYAKLGRLLRSQFCGWRAGVLLADRRLADAIGRPVEERRFDNGGLRVLLVRY
jgi:putative N6-adenine-specific DNA methylase